MKNSRKWEFAGLIIVFFTIFSINTIFGANVETFKINSPNYFNEQELIYSDIHYLESEFLSFQFCPAINTTDIKIKNICDIGEDVELKLHKEQNKKGCYFSNYNLEDMECDDFTLTIDYKTNNVNKQIKRTFTKQKQSKLINYVLGVDYALLEPDELSYYLIVLNDIISKTSDESIKAYEKLKTDRSNKDKCWPSSSCSIPKTAEILRNLAFATYAVDTRLLEDGKNYLEKNLISNTNNPLEFEITVDDNFNDSDEVQCSLKIDDEDAKNYIFDEDDPDISKEASEKIVFACNETITEITFELKNVNNNTQLTKEYTLTTGFTYEIEDFSCVGTGTTCNYDSTIDALNAYGDDINDYTLLEAYIENLIIEEPDGETYIATNDKNEDIGKYLYYEENEGLMDYLKFSQNNDGSWGSSSSKYDKIEDTSWSIIGLQKVEPASEYVLDGKKWIYFNEPETGWGDVEKNSLAYLAIKEQIKPHIKISTTNTISKWKHFDVENPTINVIRDVTVTVSKEIQPYVSYKSSLGDLEGEEKTAFNITVNDNFYGRVTGEVIVTGIDGKNKKIELAKFTINLEGPIPITLTGGKYVISEDEPIIKLNIKKNIPTFSLLCSYKNPFTKLDEKQTITQTSKTFNIDNNKLKAGEFKTDINCKYDDNEFTQSISMDVSVANKTFEITTKQYNLTNYEDFSLTLKSTSKKKQLVTFDFDGDYRGILKASETEKLVAAGDERELFFVIENPTFLEILGNATQGNILIISDTGYTKKIPIVYSIGAEPIKKGFPTWIKWVIGIFILIIIFFGINIYRYKQYLKEEEEHQGAYQEEMYLE